MRIFFDTEFTQFRDGQMLSAGFVSEDDRTFYVEIDEPARRRSASDFCQEHVISQFGLVPAAAVRSDAEAGKRIAEWILSFDSTVMLCYDYKLDWRFFETSVRAAGLWRQLAPLVQDCNIASDCNQDSALAAQESYLAQGRRPGRHHALTDAYALRQRWREYERLTAAHSATSPPDPLRQAP